MEILSNPSIIGFGIPAAVGLLKFIIDSFILKTKLKKEIELANSEILTRIRPTFAEKKRLDNKVIKAIIRSRAEKHKLEENYLYDFNEIYDQIIDEIVSISYLKNDERVNLANEVEKQRPRRTKAKKEGEKIKEFKKYLNVMNIISSVIVVIIGILIYVVLSSQPYTETTRTDFNTYFLLLAVVLLCSVLVTSIIQFNTRFGKKLKQKEDDASG